MYGKKEPTIGKVSSNEKQQFCTLSAKVLSNISIMVKLH